MTQHTSTPAWQPFDFEGYAALHRKGAQHYTADLLEALMRLVAANNTNYQRDTMRYEGLFDAARWALYRATGDAEWIKKMDDPDYIRKLAAREYGVKTVS